MSTEVYDFLVAIGIKPELVPKGVKRPKKKRPHDSMYNFSPSQSERKWDLWTRRHWEPPNEWDRVLDMAASPRTSHLTLQVLLETGRNDVLAALAQNPVLPASMLRFIVFNGDDEVLASAVNAPTITLGLLQELVDRHPSAEAKELAREALAAYEEAACQ